MNTLVFRCKNRRRYSREHASERYKNRDPSEGPDSDRPNVSKYNEVSDPIRSENRVNNTRCLGPTSSEILSEARPRRS